MSRHTILLTTTTPDGTEVQAELEYGTDLRDRLDKPELTMTATYTEKNKSLRVRTRIILDAETRNDLQARADRIGSFTSYGANWGPIVRCAPDDASWFQEVPSLFRGKPNIRHRARAWAGQQFPAAFSHLMDMPEVQDAHAEWIEHKIPELHEQAESITSRAISLREYVDSITGGPHESH